MNETQGFILAGGASSRMRRDKARLRLGNKSFIERAAIALNEITGQISIIGNLPFKSLPIEFSSGERQNLPVLGDVFQADSRAAIIGLHAALLHCRTDWAAILACDLPFVTGALLAQLFSLRNEQSDAIIPVQSDGKRQPLCAFYRRAACLPQIEKMLKGGDWSLRKFLAQINAQFVPFEQLKDLPNSDFFFLNINTPEDYFAAQKISGG